MKSPSIESIRNGLTTQLDELDCNINSISLQLKECRATRRQIASAIKALGGNEPLGGNLKPAPKKKQVKQAVDELLADNEGQIAGEDLEALVAEKLAAEQGCSAMGLALRMREVLADQDYTITDGQVKSAIIKS